MLKNGIKLEDGTHVKGKIEQISKTKKKYIWQVILKEGKKREVKRIFSYMGSKVIELHRDSFAGLGTGKLKPGKFRKLKKVEIQTI